MCKESEQANVCRLSTSHHFLFPHRPSHPLRNVRRSHKIISNRIECANCIYYPSKLLHICIFSPIFFISFHITVRGLRVVYAYHYQRRQQKQLLLLRTFCVFVFFSIFFCVCESVRTFYTVPGSQCCRLVCFYVEPWTKTTLRDICM